MYSVLLVIHVMVTLALIGIILVQRTSADGAVLSSSSSTSFMSGRTAANFVTHTTSVLAIVFILSSLGLGILTAQTHTAGTSILDRIPANKPTNDSLAPTPVPAAVPAAKTAPAAPAAQAPATKPAVPRPE